MLNEVEPNQKGYAFLTFNLNDEDACSLHAMEMQASLYK